MKRIIKILKDWLIGSFHKKQKVLNPCQLSHIPDNLKTNNRVPFQSFEVGELLFLRCEPKDLANPYNVTLSELSHNRHGWVNNYICEPNDVLYNILPNAQTERYLGKVVCTIKILDLNDNNRYDKSFEYDDNIATIQLIHDPEPCMYPHCVFRFLLNGNVITYENYKVTLAKFHKLRNSLRNEMTSMIVRESLSQTA